MTSPTTVDGLISGMNTTQVISQLLQLAARPQTNLKAQVSKENLLIGAYQSVNSKMAALQTAAEAFTQPSALTPVNPTWQAVKASSSDPSITALASTGATVGTFSFNVTQLAAAQVTTASAPSANALITSGTGIDVTVGTAAPVHLAIASGSDTAQGVASAINNAKLGISATVLTTQGGGTVLQLTGATGAANSFSVAGLTVGTTPITAAADAQITVGDPAPGMGGYTLTSPTNTFSTAVPNMSLTVSKTTAPGSPVSVTVASDPDAIADKMQAMIDAANGALSQITTSSAYSASSKTGGPLTGDFTTRAIENNVLSAVSNGQTPGYGSYKQFGVQLDSSGKLKFDRNAFITAYNANPSAVQTAVATGLAKSLDTVAKNATDPTIGSLTTVIQGGNNQIRDLKKQISDWDVRLQAKQKALQAQFSHMETALGSMKNQSNWLAGQIAGLSTGAQ